MPSDCAPVQVFCTVLCWRDGRFSVAGLEQLARASQTPRASYLERLVVQLSLSSSALFSSSPLSSTQALPSGSLGSIP